MLEGPQGAHADPPAHAVHRTGPARSPRADPPAANGLGIQKDPQGAIPLRALGPGPRTAPGPHKDKKAPAPARGADQTAPPDNAPRRGEARKGRSPCGTCSPHDAGRGPYAPQRRSGRQRSRDLPKTRKGPQGRSPPCGPLTAAHDARGRSGEPPRAHEEKRPPRARRPALPQPRAAVLSAKAGLTAGFGMGPGDPRLCGRARGGRSPAASLWSLPGTPVRGDPGGRMAGTDRRSRIALGALIEDAKSSGY